MQISRIALLGRFFKILVAASLPLVAADCHVAAGTTATLTLVDALDAEALAERGLPVQARVMFDVVSPDGDRVIPAGAMVVLSASLAAFHDVRIDIREIVVSGSAFENLGAEIASVLAVGVSVSGGLVRQSRRAFFRTITSPVRLRPGTRIKILFTEHKTFPCPPDRAAERKNHQEEPQS